MHSAIDNVKVLASLVPAVRTASANGSAVDTMGYQSVMAVISAGTIDLASGNETYDFKVQEATDSAFTTPVDISGATASVTANNDVKSIRVDGLGTGPRLRYMRIVLTAGGTTPSIAVDAVFVFLNPFQAPAN